MKKNIKYCGIVCFMLLTIMSVLTKSEIYAKEKDKSSIEVEIFKNFEKEIFSPGDKDNLKFSIKNNSNQVIKVKKIYLNYFNDELKNNFNILSKNTNVKITYKDNVIIKCTLDQLLKRNNQFAMDIRIKPHESKIFDMVIDIDKSLGNEVQGVYQEFYINAEYQVFSVDENGNDCGIESISPNTSSTFYSKYYLIIFILSASVIGVSSYIKKKYLV